MLGISKTECALCLYMICGIFQEQDIISCEEIQYQGNPTTNLLEYPFGGESLIIVYDHLSYGVVFLSSQPYNSEFSLRRNSILTRCCGEENH